MNEPVQRLDPDSAAERRSPAASAPPGSPGVPPESPDAPPGSPGAPGPVVDNRRYRWLVGSIGLVLLLAISIYQLAANRGGTIGVPAGQRLHFFSAPLAASDLVGDANPAPPCTLAGHDPRVLNVCLMAGRSPLVLAFFVTASGTCVREVDALQALSRRFSPAAVQFAAVALDSGHAATAALVRSHHWTIPVGYDADGTIAGLYRVAICPMIELARRGGVVAGRLIGDRWLRPAALAARVRSLLGGTAAGSQP